jgi:hypothetical protein
MPAIRIPVAHWGKVWRFLIATGPIGRTNKDEPIYHITDQQLLLLRKSKMPFELLTPKNGPTRRIAAAEAPGSSRQ